MSKEKPQQNKCEISEQYSKDNDKNIHFYCEFCGKEMEHDEDRVCLERNKPETPQQGWEKDIQEEFELGSPDRIKAIIHQLLIKEYRNGYNACLKDFKIKNEFGEKSL